MANGRKKTTHVEGSESDEDTETPPPVVIKDVAAFQELVCRPVLAEVALGSGIWVREVTAVHVDELVQILHACLARRGVDLDELHG